MSLYSMEEIGSSAIEIFPGRTLNINKNLENLQQEELTKILQKNSAAFAWEYTDMKGIDPKTCIHHIYIKENSRPIKQPQRRMNPNLREIVKEELQKLLNVNLIYPISDSQWVSPLVIVPKKNSKWRVCIDYRELNKTTLKDHFPLPFIDQVLDTLAGDGIKVEKYKVEVISTLPIPNCQKDVRSFLGFTGYYRRFIENFTKMTSPLFKLLTKDYEFKWNTDWKLAFEALKTKISKAPIFRGPNWKLPFHIYTDALDTALGAVLGQKELIPYPIYYTSRPRKQNTVANFLSRIQNIKEDSPVEDKFPDEYLFVVTTKTPWFADMANYLVTGKLPSHLFPKERRKIIEESSRCSWISNELYKTGPSFVFKRCVREDEMPDIFKACHVEPCGGHFADKTTTYKILSLGYYSPSIFKYAKEYVKSCDNCQRVWKPAPSNEMPLQPQVLIKPFEKWALDFIGPINPPSKKKKYILVCTDYALFFANENTVKKFLYEDIFTRFGVPREIVTDQGAQFTSRMMEKLMEEYKVKHRKSTPYHPQANGQVESTNKVIEGIITKIVHLHRRDWVERLFEALWAYRTTWRNITGHTPYELVYGKEVLLPIEFQVKTFKMAVQLGMDLSEAQKHRLEQLNELDEVRQ
eukprot:PITA_16303